MTKPDQDSIDAVLRAARATTAHAFSRIDRSVTDGGPLPRAWTASHRRGGGPDPVTGLVSGFPTNNDGRSDEELRRLLLEKLRAAFEEVYGLIEDTQDAIVGIDDLIPQLDALTGEQPRLPDMDEPWENGRLIDLDLPFAVTQTLQGAKGMDKPLRVERAALIVYLDALERHQHTLFHLAQDARFTPEDLFPGDGPNQSPAA